MADIGFFEHIATDLSGKGQFRLFLQPAMAIFLGIKLGLKDAKAGKAPFLMRMVKDDNGWDVFKESLRDAAIPLLLAFVVDSIFQYITLKHIRPMAAVVVGTILVWIPFTVSRALSNRVWTRGHGGRGVRPRHA